MAVSDYELGPCQILFGGSDLGKTQGGVTVNLSETFATLNTDQHGESPVDEIKTGTAVNVTGNLAEITLANIAQSLKTSVESSGDKEKVVILAGVGTSLYENSERLVIKPYENGTITADQNKWITLLHAGLKATASLTYNAADQRVINFEATGYPDRTSDEIAIWGDTTVA